MFQGGRYGVDVKIWVGDVIIVTALEAFTDLKDLRVAAGLAVDAFDVHAYMILLGIGKGIRSDVGTSCFDFFYAALDNARNA